MRMGKYNTVIKRSRTIVPTVEGSHRGISAAEDGGESRWKRKCGRDAGR